MNRTLTLLTILTVTLLASVSWAQPARDANQATLPTSQSPNKDTRSQSMERGTADGRVAQEENQNNTPEESTSSHDDPESSESEEPSSEDSTSEDTNETTSTELKLRSPFESGPVEEVEITEDDDDTGEAPDEEEVVTETDVSESPIADLALDDTEFEPLDDIEEGALEEILPGKIHPRFEWRGYFRTRADMAVNYDLDTLGTSAVIPVTDSLGALPADKDKKIAISTNMRFNLAPTLFITDELRIVSEFDILDNVVLGDSPQRRVMTNTFRPELSAPVTQTTQFSLADAIKVRQLYGVVDSLFGSLYAGRMDSHIGLGILDHNGDCIDCDYGTSIDRVKLETRLFGITAGISLDFPDEGISTQVYPNGGGQAYDLAQVDDVDQFTVELEYAPKSELEHILEQRKLRHEGLPIFNAGMLFRWRKQDGMYSAQPTEVAGFPNVLPTLIYKGLTTYTFDMWGKMLYNPNDELYAKLALEGFVNIGSVDNVSNQPVGQATDTQPAVNCFSDDGVKQRCNQTVDGVPLSRKFVQWSLALESEFRIGKIASWGLNLGVASGGKTPNWGMSGAYPDFDFAQFNRDYHVDLILFRNVIGTVTNAAYFKPFVHLEFLESGSRHLEADISSIFSLAVDKEGTPSGQRMLGAEFNGAIRYILRDQLNAGFEAGILFPLSGLGAVLGRPRYQRFDSRGSDFTEDRDPSIAWTLQGKLAWMF